MLISQLEFALLFPFIFFFYWLIPIKYNKYRNLFLLFVSYLLYMNWKPAFAIVLLGVTLVTYLGGRFLESNGERYTIKSKRIRLVWFFALLGLLPLLVFKYYNFLNDSISAGLASVGLHFEMPGLNWAVPVGISFFTFQAVGYLLDVYHQRINPEKNFLLYALFVSFFPQITSGPISTASSLIPQFKRPHTFNYDQAVAGLRMLLWGLFLKVAIADRAGVYVDTVYSDISKFPAINCALASFLYTIQIYCDFPWQGNGVANIEEGYVQAIREGVSQVIGENNNPERWMPTRSRILQIFEPMAKLGFYSYDCVQELEKGRGLYRLVAYPDEDISEKQYIIMPEFEGIEVVEEDKERGIILQFKM